MVSQYNLDKNTVSGLPPIRKDNDLKQVDNLIKGTENLVQEVQESTPEFNSDEYLFEQKQMERRNRDYGKECIKLQEAIYAWEKSGKPFSLAEVLIQICTKTPKKLEITKDFFQKYESLTILEKKAVTERFTEASEEQREMFTHLRALLVTKKTR